MYEPGGLVILVIQPKEQKHGTGNLVTDSVVVSRATPPHPSPAPPPTITCDRPGEGDTMAVLFQSQFYHTTKGSEFSVFAAR